LIPAVSALCPATVIVIETWQTARTQATALSPAHFELMRRLHTDAAVMQTLSADGQALSEAQTAAAVDAGVEHWRQHGFGFWVFHQRGSGEFLGHAGLKRYALSGLDGREEAGLAYALLSQHWHQGYATEMARAVLSVGFMRLELPRIGCWTLPQNRASQRVIDKLGFKYERDFEFAGLTHRYYSMQSADFMGQAD
jgi:[ribosomal protein S5]-alanine N-acetyltransferase